MKGKKTLLLLVCSGITLISVLFLSYGYKRTWRLWNIPVMSPHFCDLRTITGAGESQTLGLDPLTNNPGDPWGRRMNYPRIWQGLSVLGIDQRHTTCVGIILIGLFLLGIFLFIDKTDNATALFLTLGIFSPAVLLGIERGNNDLLIFFLLSLALFFFVKRPVVSMSLVHAGFVLKLYPLFGLGCLLGQNKKTFLKLAIASSIIIVMYIWLTFEDIIQIRQATPRTIYMFAYGVDVVWMSVEKGLHSVTAGRIVFFLSYGMVIALFVLSWLNRNKFKSSLCASDNYIDSFRIGSAIYIGTFMLGNNSDYRLMFLLFAIPQLLLWARHTSGHISWISKITIVAMFISFWILFLFHFMSIVPYGKHVHFLLNHSSKWTVFAGLLCLFICSMPNWTDNYIVNFIPWKTLSLKRRDAKS